MSATPLHGRRTGGGAAWRIPGAVGALGHLGAVLVLGAALLCGTAATGLDAQEPAPVRVVQPGGEEVALAASDDRGYVALPASSLEALGWEVVDSGGPEWRLRHDGGAEIGLLPGEPFFRWEGTVQQLVDPPYLDGGALWVPAQLVLDFLPHHLPDDYRLAWAAGGPELRVVDRAAAEREAAGDEAARASARVAAERDPAPRAPEGAAADPLRDPGPLVVVIDPGHGGRDLGAVGLGGSREKDVALSLGRALARELSGYPGLEVHLTRDSDELVPLWRRGEWATEVKGERSGVFLSLHANAMADRANRGFETYFLSEARTEHERRVAAIENEPLGLSEESGGDLTDLGFILNELRNHDHQHWSALLAELVQERLRPVHPGPDRGVKQGPFAVITNALMPAVLVEVGFMSNREEERLLGRAAFQDDVAGALADAVVEFFRRYPPSQGRALEVADPRGSGP